MGHGVIVSAFWWASRHICPLIQLVGFSHLLREDSSSWLSERSGRGPTPVPTPSVLSCLGGFRMLDYMVRNSGAQVEDGGLRFISNRGPTSASWICFGGIFTKTWCLATSECYVHKHTWHGTHRNETKSSLFEKVITRLLSSFGTGKRYFNTSRNRTPRREEKLSNIR